MSSPKVFASPASGSVPLPHHAQDEAQAHQTLFKKRSADILDSLTPRQKKARTDALERERQRYEKLKADPLCIASPTCGKYVQCARCGRRIKLSDKNNYDAQHWTKHRKTCLRQPDAVVAALRAKSSLGQRRTSCTPELTADSASERTGTSAPGSVKSEPASSRAPSPSPSIHSPLDRHRGHQTAPLTAQAACDSYMAIAHPDIAPAPACATLEDVLEQIQAWTPGRTRAPVCFPAPEVDPTRLVLTPAEWSDDSDSEQEEDRMDVE